MFSFLRRPVFLLGHYEKVSENKPVSRTLAECRAANLCNDVAPVGSCVSQSDQISGRAPFCLQEELRTKIVPVPVMQRRSCFLQYFLELCGGDIKLRGALLCARICHQFVCLCFRLWYPRTQICFSSVSRGFGDICTSASVCSLQHDDTLLMSVQTMTNTLFEAQYFLTQPGKKSGAWPKTYQEGLHF